MSLKKSPCILSTNPSTGAEYSAALLAYSCRNISSRSFSAGSADSLRSARDSGGDDAAASWVMFTVPCADAHLDPSDLALELVRKSGNHVDHSRQLQHNALLHTCTSMMALERPCTHVQYCSNLHAAGMSCALLQCYRQQLLDCAMCGVLCSK